MSEYGQIINPQYDPEKNNVYDAFSNYYNNPSLTKIKNVDELILKTSKTSALKAINLN